MRRNMLTALCVGSMVGVMLLAARGGRCGDDPDDQERADARKDVMKLADAVGGNSDDVGRQARAAAKYPVEDVHRVFMRPEQGGLGIERKLIALGKATPTGKELEDQRDDLNGAAKVVWAVAEIAPFQADPFVKNDKDRMEWAKFSADMKHGATALIDALKAGDAKAARAAALDIRGSCEDCHKAVDGL